MAIPEAGVWGGALRARQLAYERAKAMLAAQKADTQSLYGFRPDMSPDVGNQTGLYWQQRRGQGMEADQLVESQAQRGFTGGLLQQQTNKLKYSHDSQSSDMMRQLLSSMSANAQGVSENESAWGMDQADIMAQASQAAIQDRNFMPAPASGPRLPSGKVGFKWGKETWGKSEQAGFIKWLNKRGIGYKKWAKAHPNLAKTW